MTTYPLSEPATIHAIDENGEVTGDVVGQGALEACADLVAGLPSGRQESVCIRMDAIDLAFGPTEIRDLIKFLREEDTGLSNSEIAEIRTSDA
ncbi:hypothetical protein [Sphingomonas sp. CFBP 13720]|uniref:hypothetical protein n=1 Tax=Sphingomonas sp. CFBP 13720 TaxID=2775302 RepID=UPI0017818F31|nr:hypothetical protein [Sphingomonas sp. CFBP 13720]MBD8680067.1 hypothetical protein [Sphingomonas sp. CFBP 13720]